MTDRELLELAAKAAGLEYDGADEYGDLELKNGVNWNPFFNDAQAFRLMVSLQIGAGRYESCTSAHCTGREIDDVIVRDIEELNPMHSMRRAIVCAAAEIGRSMSHNAGVRGERSESRST